MTAGGRSRIASLLRWLLPVVGLGLVLLATLLVLGAGVAAKAPCASGDWADGRQYKHLCYSDVVPLYGTEHLQERRLPYLDACPANEGQCDEYPVLTMYAMRLTAWLYDATGGPGGFFYWNVVLLVAFAFAVLCLTSALQRRVLPL
jgi:uncharacterized membrane protein